MTTKEEERELERFVHFMKRLQDEGLLDGTIGLMNIDPKTNDIDIIRLKGSKRNKVLKTTIKGG